MTENAGWEAVKRSHHYRCCICRQPEKVTGTLVPLVTTEHEGSPSRTVPLCPDHHLRYVQGFFTNAELKKIGISREEYAESRAEDAASPASGSGLSAAEKVTLAKEETVKKIQKAKKTKMPRVHSDYQKVI